MSMKIYSLFDRKLAEFGSLAVSPNDGAIVRAILDIQGKTNTPMDRHPEDFDIYCLGEFDTLSGHIAASSGKSRLVCNVGEQLTATSGVRHGDA